MPQGLSQGLEKEDFQISGRSKVRDDAVPEIWVTGCFWASHR